MCGSVFAGELTAAEPLLEESDAIVEATGIELASYGGLLLRA
ncbi:hypothetical protein AB0K15_32550 [Amycolatopsis sp. NPDC049253]